MCDVYYHGFSLVKSVCVFRVCGPGEQLQRVLNTKQQCKTKNFVSSATDCLLDGFDNFRQPKDEAEGLATYFAVSAAIYGRDAATCAHGVLSDMRVVS